jgi:hypothetical protein
MKHEFSKTKVAMAVTAALGATLAATAPVANAGKPGGTYVTGDFHNHTTCSDGSISMQKLVSKSTNGEDVPWGLDWFVQAGHGGNGNRNCTLVEDESLATPAYPVVTAADGTTVQGPNTTWLNTNPPIQPKGDVSGSGANRNMWRWQAVQEFQYPVVEYLAAYTDKPLFLGVESVVAGHEHTSMAVITGQVPASVYSAALPTTRGYAPLGNANALAQWQYCFDRGNSDLSRGNTTSTSGVGNNWDCSVPGSLNNLDPSWNTSAMKLNPAGGTGTGDRGHNKTVEAMKWMKEFHPEGSYYVPAHLERAGPFNPNGNNGFNIEHIRNFNNAAPRVAFGMETQPGHGASDNRGEYSPRRNNFGSGIGFVDSVGGTTWGGTGIYGAQIGGVWDALLGEGRNFWFFASSDWHNRGSFGPDDRRTTQDFYPGEYQRDYVMVHPNRTRSDRNLPLNPQEIVDGLRSGNSWTDSGQLVDRLAFVACADTRLPDRAGNAIMEAATLVAAVLNTDVDLGRCATMGEKLVLRPGEEVVVAIVARDPSGTSYSPYTFPNPSLAQIGTQQPLNKPVLDHIDVVRGLVTGYRDPANPATYAGEWPRDWINNQNLANVPAAAKNTSAAVLKTFSANTWNAPRGAAGEFKRVVFRIPNVQQSQYLRLRGTNLPASVPFETDANGNPLADLWTNASSITGSGPSGSEPIATNGNLRIPCTAVGTTDFDGCPAHMGARAGVKYSSYDVAAWADLWFYSNPIYIEVQGGTKVAGVQ